MGAVRLGGQQGDTRLVQQAAAYAGAPAVSTLAGAAAAWCRYSAREAKKAASELKEVTKAGKSARHLGNEAFQ